MQARVTDTKFDYRRRLNVYAQAQSRFNKPISYRRFSTATEAIRFAVENLADRQYF